MIAGNEAVKTGRMQESQVRLKLENLGFCCSANNKEDKSIMDACNGMMPERYARSGYRYKSLERPTTKAVSDWSVFVGNMDCVDLHIESKNQTTGGSVAAKSVTAVLELVGVIATNQARDCFLLLPGREKISDLSPCDGEYFMWAMRLANENGIPCGGMDSLMNVLDKKYRRVQKWN